MNLLKHSMGLILSILIVFTFYGCDTRSTKYLDPSSQGSFSPYPDDNSTNNPVRQTLTWEYKSIADSYNYRYSICFGKDSSPELVSINQEEIYFLPPDMLDYETTYYWKIVAHDSGSDPAESPVWSFKTAGIEEMFLVRSYETGAVAIDVHVEGDYAYIAADRDGFLILDLNLPTESAIIGSLTTHDGMSVEHVAYSNNYAYAYCFMGSGGPDQWGKINIIDVSDPFHPEFIDSLWPLIDTYNIVVYKDYLLVTQSLEDKVFDISDPTNIMAIPNDFIPSRGILAVKEDNLYIYFNDEIRSYDISDFDNPIPLANYAMSTKIWDYDVANGYVYSVNAEGINVISIGNCTNVHATTSFELPYRSGHSMFVVPGHAIYAANGWDGISLFQVKP
ncbi:MAG: hypothetical protein GY839_06735 [candidate division Zixibacteria bacterium]|nr:hypothetical protein [candidate division Zixibacteria bacterium]